MPRVNWIIPCTKASVDANNQTVSLIEVIEGLKTAAAPLSTTATTIVPIQFDVVISISRLPGEPPQNWDIRSQFFHANGTVMGATPPISADLINGSRNRTIIHISGLAVNGPGIYTVTAEIQDPASGNWNTGASADIEVT